MSQPDEQKLMDEIDAIYQRFEQQLGELRQERSRQIESILRRIDSAKAATVRQSLEQE